MYSSSHASPHNVGPQNQIYYLMDPLLNQQHVRKHSLKKGEGNNVRDTCHFNQILFFYDFLMQWIPILVSKRSRRDTLCLTFLLSIQDLACDQLILQNYFHFKFNVDNLSLIFCFVIFISVVLHHLKFLNGIVTFII